MKPSTGPGLFSEYQINHLVGTFHHIDQLLGSVEVALMDDSRGLFPEHVQDLGAEQKARLVAFVTEFRNRLSLKMEEYNIDRPTPKTTASRAVESALIFIDIALDDLRPQTMRGYGALSQNASAELHRLIHELQSLTASVAGTSKPLEEGEAS